MRESQLYMWSYVPCHIRFFISTKGLGGRLVLFQHMTFDFFIDLYCNTLILKVLHWL